MTSEQKFVWWLKGVLDSSNGNPDFELVREELEKVIESTMGALTVSTPYTHSTPTPSTFDPIHYPPQPTVIRVPDTTPWTPVITCTADIDKGS